VFFVKGDVVFGHAESNQFPSVRPKSKIRSGGDTVRTSDGASINLALLPAHLLDQAAAWQNCRVF
jgi:hypothetical protein